MKKVKVLLSLLIVLVLFWNCGTALAKGKDRGKSTGKQGKRAMKVQEKGRGRQTDANEPGKQGKGKRMRQREPQQIREISSKGKGKSKSGRDVNQPAAKLGENRGKGRLKARQDVNELSGKFGKGKGKGPSVEKDTGKGKWHQQQLQAVEKQMLHEEAKHLWRVARLKRIRELAEGDTKTTARVDKLLEKEQKRYDRKRQRMQERKQKILLLAEKSLSEEAQEAVKKGADKEKVKPKEQNEGKAKGKDEDTGEEADE